MRLTTFFKKLLHLTSPVTDVTIESDPVTGPAAIIDVKPRNRNRCGDCGRKCSRRHGAEGKLRTWRHLGLFGLVVKLRCQVYRVICDRCGGIRTTSVPWSRKGSVFTRAFEDETGWFLQHTDQTATATYMGISWVTVGNIARRVVDEKLDGSLLSDLHFIGVDEICYGRPKKFLTVVADHERGRVVWAAEGKSSETLGRFFEQLGPTRLSIEVVTMDMSAAYVKSVGEWIPQAEIVFDRFHVVRLLMDAVDEVRRAEMRTLAEAEDRKDIKSSRFALLKNPWNLGREEEQKLSDVQRNNRRLFRAYLLKETFQEIYNSATVEEADRLFADWYPWARRSKLAPFVTLAKTMKEHWAGIRRFIELRITNGPVEGFNSKIRMISHRAFGFHSAQALIAMIMLLCSGITLSALGHGKALHTL